MDVVIVIPHFDQASQTRMCLDNRRDAGVADSGRKYRLTWFNRQRRRLEKKILIARWRISGPWRYGGTLISQPKRGAFLWR
jgi:hypothetical protein